MQQGANNNAGKPNTFQGDLAKVSRALAPLITRPSWGVWRWVHEANGRWTKPPFQARDPHKYLSTKDPATWSDYHAALAATQAGQADGISYVLTDGDGLAAIDLDHCRNAGTGTIDEWAQDLIDQARDTYVEITPSGAGLRIWGTAQGGRLHRKCAVGSGKPALELFRGTHKALTVTGLQLGHSQKLGNIDRLLDRAVTWAEGQRSATANTRTSGNGFDPVGVAAQYSVDQIERIIREGAPEGSNRSDLFHAIIGHLYGCGLSAEQIAAHLAQYPAGIGGRYLSEGRLCSEIRRSLDKYRAWRTAEGPLFEGGAWTGAWQSTASASPETEQSPKQEPDSGVAEQEREPEPEHPESQGKSESEPREDAKPEPEDQNQEAGPEQQNESEQGEPEPEEVGPELPPMYAHGDPDPRPLKSWVIKRLMPTCGHGLLSGQWGTYKSFIALDIAAAAMTGQPFLGFPVKRQCGVLFIAAEGADEMRLRVNAVARAKCGGTQRAFRWYETAPVLLQPGAVEKLVAMAKLADASLQQEFGLPLGLIILDTIAASAGYAQPGAENDNAVGQHLMNVLKKVAQEMSCFVLGIDHFGKNTQTGTRGSSSKEASSDLVLACLGEREPNGWIVNTRLAVRKNRAGPSGQEYLFGVRVVEDPEPDEDGEAVTTLVIDWQPGMSATQAGPQTDPWQQGRQADTRAVMCRLKQVLMTILADRGVNQLAGPNGPEVRMVDREIVRQEFYARTAADGTPEQKSDYRRKQFNRAITRAEKEQLIGIRDIGGLIYIWLAQPGQPDGEAF